MKLMKFILPVLLVAVVAASGSVAVCLFPKSPLKNSQYCSKLNKLIFKSASDQSAFGGLIEETKETTGSEEDEAPIKHPSYEDNIATMRATYGFDLDEAFGNFISYDGNLLKFSIESIPVELKPAQNFLVLCTQETIGAGGKEINSPDMLVDYSSTPDSELIEIISGYLAVDSSTRDRMLRSYEPGKPIRVATKNSEFLHVGIYSQNCEQLYQL